MNRTAAEARTAGRHHKAGAASRGPRGLTVFWCLDRRLRVPVPPRCSDTCPPRPALQASPRSRPLLTSSWLPGGHGAGDEGAARRGASGAAGPGRGGSASGWAAGCGGGSSSPAGVRAASCEAARPRRRRRLTAGPRPLPSWRARVPGPTRARAARQPTGRGRGRAAGSRGRERARASALRLGAAAGGWGAGCTRGGGPLRPLRGLRAPTALGPRPRREWARAAEKLHTKGAGLGGPRL